MHPSYHATIIPCNGINSLATTSVVPPELAPFHPLTANPYLARRAFYNCIGHHPMV